MLCFKKPRSANVLIESESLSCWVCRPTQWKGYLVEVGSIILCYFTVKPLFFFFLAIKRRYYANQRWPKLLSAGDLTLRSQCSHCEENSEWRGWTEGWKGRDWNNKYHAGFFIAIEKANTFSLPVKILTTKNDAVDQFSYDPKNTLLRPSPEVTSSIWGPALRKGPLLLSGSGVSSLSVSHKS